MELLESPVREAWIAATFSGRVLTGERLDSGHWSPRVSSFAGFLFCRSQGGAATGWFLLVSA